MKDEIKEILDKLNNKAEHYILYDYEIKTFLDYITNLQEKLEEAEEKIRIYEAPDDLALFYMWLDEKAKDKMKQLQEENKKLKEQNIMTDEQIEKAFTIASERIYKSRNEKAKEYGNNCLENLDEYDYVKGDCVDIVYLLRNIHKNYIDILQGEDK